MGMAKSINFLASLPNATSNGDIFVAEYVMKL
jgi:hypothetical protein